MSRGISVGTKGFWVAEWHRRPWWMQLLFGFCVYMTFIYMPFDLFLKPVAVDEEVWFGITLHGWAAKATAPFHWLIYGAGAYGFWRMRAWMWPWAAVYAAQVCIAMLVWNLLDPRGGGWLPGLVAAAVFAVPTVALWRARPLFVTRRGDRAVRLIDPGSESAGKPGSPRLENP